MIRQKAKLEQKADTQTERKSRMYGMAMIGLILSAFAVPQLILVLQDSYQVSQTRTGSRSEVDLSILNHNYEQDVETRLANFAKGLAEGKQYYISATDYTIDKSCYELVEKSIFSQEWYYYMYMDDSLLSAYQGGYDAVEWKRYVIYDEDMENGIALMAWYLKLRMTGAEAEFLIDTETNTVYYVREQDMGETAEAKENPYMTLAYYDPYQLTVDLPTFWTDYYSGKSDTTDTELLEKYGVEMNGQTEEIQVYDQDKEEMEEQLTRLYESYCSKGFCHFLIPVKGYTLEWRITPVQGKSISYGLQAIGDLIPEF